MLKKCLHTGRKSARSLMILDRFTEAELDYCAYPGGWPVGQVFIHIASSEHFWMQHCIHAKPHTSFELANFHSKAQIKAGLDEVHQQTLTWMAGLTESDLALTAPDDEGVSNSYYWMIWHVIEHEAHHRGELSLILGILGRSGWGM
jgi:uncharacterized damage-inducible protein DinB